MSTGYRDAPKRVLGTEIRTFEVRKTLVGRIAMSLFLCGPAFALWMKADFKAIPIFDGDSIWVVQASMALIFLGLPLLAVVMIVNALRHRHDCVTLFEDGFVLSELGVETRVLWSDVKSLKIYIVQSARSGITHSHDLVWSNGKTCFTGNYDAIDELVALLRVKTAEVLLPRAREDREAGRTIEFGPLALEADALRVRETRLPLSKLDRVDLQAGVLKIYGKGKSEPWAEQDAHQVSNLHVLLALLPTDD